MMLDVLIVFIKMLADIFGKLPKGIQENIIKLIVDYFDWIFRSYFREMMKKGNA